jgi:adenylate cyclase
MQVTDARASCMSLFSELKRRNVFRAAAAYVAVAWLLIQVAETTFPAFGLDDAKLRALIVVLAIGFVPAVALSWAFELTPDGWKHDSELERDGTLARRTNRLLDRVIMVLLGLGLTYFAVDKFLIDPARDEARVEQALEQGRAEALEAALAKQSIVVLPFANMSPDPEQAYFADGMAEELLNLLARIPELRVISRTSAFSFKDKSASVGEIAEQLKVSHVLEGSVRRSGDRVRITAQLIEARTDAHLWSETYDRELGDMFAIQDEIASHVVNALRLELLGAAPKARRFDPQAYLLTMQARQMLLNLSFDGREATLEGLLKEAVALDTGYSEPWVQLSHFYRFGRTQNRKGERAEFWKSASPDEWVRRSDEALARALELDPDNPRAIALSAHRRASPDQDLQAVARDFERALALDPADPDTLRYAGQFASAIGRFDVGTRLGEFSVERDPLCLMCLYWLGQTYLFAGRLDDAEPRVRTYVASGRGGRYTLGQILLLKGNAREALAEFEQVEESLEPWSQAGRAMALHALGRQADSDAALAELEAVWGERLPHLPAEVYSWTGRPVQAWAWLDRIDRPSYIDPWSPLLQPLAADARWKPYWARFGITLEEIAALQFAPVLPGNGTIQKR